MNEEGPWTIGELSNLVLRALHTSGMDADYAGQPSRRVRSIPDERTIRWYSTIGLLDRPVAMRGRTALYGRRHLFQLVAVKRLQAQGRTLAQVQEDLVGATDATLEGIAHLPVDLMEIAVDEGPSDYAVGRLVLRRPRRFWAAGTAPASSSAPDDPDSPAAADDDTVTMDEFFTTVARATRWLGDDTADDSVTEGMEPEVAQAAGPRHGDTANDSVTREDARTAAAQDAHPRRGETIDDSVTEGSAESEAARTARFGRSATIDDTVAKHAAALDVVQAVRLGGGVTLLLGATARALNADDLAMLHQAAGPLLDLLRERGLDRSDPGGTRDEHPS